MFRPVPHPRRLGHDDDALGVRRALVLADAAARAVVFVDVDAVLAHLQGHRADGAVVDADRALVAVTAHAEVFVPVGRAHVDLGQWHELERAAGATVHARERRAKDAGHLRRIDVGRAVAPGAAVVDLDALRGADAHALAAAA